MKIELKNIQYSDKLSEESNAFSADLYIEGKMAGTASNRGRGGATTCRANDENGRKLIAEAESYCKGLPPYDMDLGDYLDNLIQKYLEEKDKKQFQKKMEGDMKKGIVAGIPNKSYGLWKFTMSMEQILEHPKGRDLLNKVLTKKIIPTLTDGKIILNTNIPVSIYKAAGLRENQYAEQAAKDTTVKMSKKKPGRNL